MKVYISGPITGTTDYKERFEKAEEFLKSKGYEVINPVKLNEGFTGDWEQNMRRCIKAMMDCDGIYMLKGWQASRGARFEWDISTELFMWRRGEE